MSRTFKDGIALGRKIGKKKKSSFAWLSQKFLFRGQGYLGIFCLVLILNGCTQKKINILQVTDEPLTAVVQEMDIPELAPAYGVVTGSFIEVNLEKQDGSLVKRGQMALVQMGSKSSNLECRVERVVANVNYATGQSIAWLQPLKGQKLMEGDFVSAEIILKVKRHVLAVPREAIYIRDGQTMVLLKQMAKEGGVNYLPTTVQTGISSDTDVEILSGLKAGDEVVTQAGIGYLYPEFKAEADD